MRPGSTLSPILRTMWDCHATELINKNSPMRCNEPYLIDKRQHHAGRIHRPAVRQARRRFESPTTALATGFFYLWVQRDKLVAHPQATPGLDAMMDEIAGNIFSVYEALKPDGAFLSTPIDFSPEAYARYEPEYQRIANLKAAGRRPPS